MPIDDKRIVRIVQRCQELPGQHLFQYVADDGSRCPVDSGQVNEYLREAMGDDFTAKDFRTWGATLHALVLLGRIPRDSDASESALKRAIAGVVKQVASELRNTPAVCRKSYINPLVFDGWRSGAIHEAFGGSLSSHLDAQGRDPGAQLSQVTFGAPKIRHPYMKNCWRARSFVRRFRARSTQGVPAEAEPRDDEHLAGALSQQNTGPTLRIRFERDLRIDNLIKKLDTF